MTGHLKKRKSVRWIKNRYNQIINHIQDLLNLNKELIDKMLFQKLVDFYQANWNQIQLKIALIFRSKLKELEV